MSKTNDQPVEPVSAREPMAQRIEDLEQQVREQAELLDRALSRLDTATASGADEATNRADQPDAGPSRRALLRGGALALGAGVASAAAIASPAAAANGDPINIGEVNTGSLRTDLRIDAGSPLGHNVFTAQDSGFGTSSLPAALGGYATGTRVGNGMYGYTNSNVESDTFSGYGVAAACDGRGTTSRAQLFMFPLGPVPTADTISHLPGELVASGDNRLWFCTGAGTPGTWEEITGVRPLVTAAQSAADAAQVDIDALETRVDAIASGPTFLPTSQRAFDSRPGEPGNGGSKGTLTSGESRVVDLTVDTDLPAGARAAIVHLTLAGSASAGGFLSVYSATVADLSPPGFSSLNWSATGQFDANTTVTAISPAGAVKLFALNAAHAAIDVIGYYT